MTFLTTEITDMPTNIYLFVESMAITYFLRGLVLTIFLNYVVVEN